MYRKSVNQHIDMAKSIQLHMTFIRQNFIVVIKCLTVLLDWDLLDVAIIGTSYARKLATYKINKSLEYDKELARKMAEGIFVDIFHEDAPKPSETFTHVEEHVKLESVVKGSDDFVLHNRASLDATIDRYMENEIRTRPTNDMRLLVDFCEQLSPASPRLAHAQPVGIIN